MQAIQHGCEWASGSVLLGGARSLVEFCRGQMARLYGVFPPGRSKRERGPSTLFLCSGPRAFLQLRGWGGSWRRGWGGHLLLLRGACRPELAGTFFPGKTVPLGMGAPEDLFIPRERLWGGAVPRTGGEGLAQAGSFPKQRIPCCVSLCILRRSLFEGVGVGGASWTLAGISPAVAALQSSAAWFPQMVCFPAKISVSSETQQSMKVTTREERHPHPTPPCPFP